MRYKLHIPFTRTDSLRDAVESVRDIGNIHVWCGGFELPPLDIPDVTVHHHGAVSCISLFNMCFHFSRGDDVAFFAHDDMRALPGAAKRLQELTEEARASGEKWGAVFYEGDVLSSFNMAAVRDVGPWDTMFFQYRADGDYCRTLEAAGWKIIRPPHLPIAVIHEGQGTKRADDLYAYRTDFRAASRFDDNYYRLKWGGDIHREKFSAPFEKRIWPGGMGDPPFDWILP